MRGGRLIRMIGTALSVVAASLLITAVGVPAEEGTPAGGTITQCPGFPIPPFSTRTEDGVTITVGDICHVYAGTIEAVVLGVQRTTIFPDGSRILMGEETLVGTIGGRSGTAELHFRGTRDCVPTCPVTIEVRSEHGSGNLDDLHLSVTAVGVKVLVYSGTYRLP